MIDTILDWAGKILNFGAHWPDLTSIVIGTVSGWALAALVELYVIPLNASARSQKGLTALVTVVTSAIASSLIWGVMAPHDPPKMRIVVSCVLAPISPFSYVLVGALLTKYFPSIGSIWAPKP